MTASAAVALGFISQPPAALSHHSPNVHFDRTETVEFTGELTQITWRNPHVLMSVRTTNDNGEHVVWNLEYLAPSFLSRQGISKELFTTGDIVRVAGFRGRTNPTALFATNILAADGREVFDFQFVESRFTEDIVGVTYREYQEARKRALPESADGIFRVWTTDVSVIGPDRTLWKDRRRDAGPHRRPDWLAVGRTVARRDRGVDPRADHPVALSTREEVRLNGRLRPVLWSRGHLLYLANTWTSSEPCAAETLLG